MRVEPSPSERRSKAWKSMLESVLTAVLFMRAEGGEKARLRPDKRSIFHT